MSSLFRALPDVIAAEILTAWLELGDVIRLDSAACSGDQQVRRNVLACLYSSTTVYDTSRAVRDFSPRTGDCCNKWLFSRKVYVNTVYLSAAFVKEQDQCDGYLRACGSTIRAIYSGKEPLFCPIPITAISTYCPNVISITCPPMIRMPDYTPIVHAWPRLTEITVSHGICDEGLLLIAQGCRELVHVSIDACLTAEEKAPFIAALPSTVQTLRLGETRCVDETEEGGAAASAIMLSAVLAAHLPHLRALSEETVLTLKDEDLLALAQRCSLQTLHLRRYDRVTEGALMALPGYCQLRELSISRELRLSEVCVTALLRGCAQTLTKLKFESYGCSSPCYVLSTLGEHCVNLQDLVIVASFSKAVAGWEALAQGCPKLTALLAYCAGMTDAGLAALAEGCANLSSLRLQENNNYLTDSGLQAVGRYCKHLRTLRLLGRGQMTEAGVRAVATGCRHLREVQIDVNCGDGTLIVLAEHCRDLRALELSRQLGSGASSAHSVTDSGVTALLVACGKLRKLGFNNAPYLTEGIISVIAAHCLLLRELSFFQCAAFRRGRTHIYKGLFLHSVYIGIA